MGKNYEIVNDTDVKPIPLLLFERIIGLKEKIKPETTSEHPDYKGNDEKPAKQINKGARNETLFTTVTSLKLNGLSKKDAIDVITSINRMNCKDPLDGSEIQKLVTSAYSYIPNSGYQVIEPEKAIQLLDDKGYFVAGLADKTFVWEAFKDNQIEYWNRTTFKSFREKHINIDVDVGSKKPIPIGDYWIKNTTKRYDYALFNPSKPSEYIENNKHIKNLWEGFSFDIEQYNHASDPFH